MLRYLYVPDGYQELEQVTVFANELSIPIHNGINDTFKEQILDITKPQVVFLPSNFGTEIRRDLKIGYHQVIRYTNEFINFIENKPVLVLQNPDNTECVIRPLFVELSFAKWVFRVLKTGKHLFSISHNGEVINEVEFDVT